ncbi:MAG: DUF2628 domain-containing protein [Woeseiaceae bacterium]|nr:DUF2628 domain-containing protein [Woeseiaceae bacterium]
MDEARLASPSEDPERSDDLARSLVVALACVLGVLAAALLSASMSIFMPELIEKYGIPLEDVGLFFVGRGIVAAAVILPIAFLADRFGYSLLLATVLGAASICVLIAESTTSLNLAITTHVFASMLGVAAISVAVVLVFNSVSKQWRSTSLGVLLAAPYAAFLLAALLYKWEISRESIAIGSAIGAAACAVIIALLRETPPRHLRRLRPNLFAGGVIWLLAAAALFASLVGALKAWTSTDVYRFDETFAEAVRSQTWVLALPSLGAVSGMLVGGIAADLLGRRSGRPDLRISIFAAIVAAIAGTATTLFDQPELFFASISVLAFGKSVAFVLTHSSAQRLANRHFAAATAAVVSVAGTMGLAVGISVASSLFAAFDGARTPAQALDSTLIWTSVAGFVAAILFFLAWRKETSEQVSIDARQPIPSGRHSVYVRQYNEVGVAEHVKNGFSWPAFFFGPIWALTKGLMLRAAVIFLINIALFVFFFSGEIIYFLTGDVRGHIHLTPVAVVANVLWFVWVGARGNSWRRRLLIRRGYEEHIEEQ